MENNTQNYMGSTTIAKLVLLYVFDKMETPLTESTVLNICTNKNDWVNYMTCKEVLAELLDIGFLTATTSGTNEPFYSISAEGRACLSYFFVKIPSSVREDITAFVKENRMQFRRMQEYFRDYYKNADGTYTVLLKIIEPSATLLEIKFNAPNRAAAVTMYKRWEEKASEIFANIHDTLQE